MRIRQLARNRVSERGDWNVPCVGSVWYDSDSDDEGESEEGGEQAKDIGDEEDDG